MARAWLRDDVGYVDDGVSVALDGDGHGVPAFLDPDEASVDAVATSTVVQVRQRDFAGYDDDGNPEFLWVTVVDGDAVVWEVADEVDQFTSALTGMCVVLYDGDVVVTEGAVVVKDGVHWDVLQVKRPEGRLEFKIRRVAAL